MRSSTSLRHVQTPPQQAGLVAASARRGRSDLTIDPDAVRAYGAKAFAERQRLLRAADKARDKAITLLDHADPYVVLAAAKLVMAHGLPPWQIMGLDRGAGSPGQTDGAALHLEAMMVFARGRIASPGGTGTLLVEAKSVNDFNGLEPGADDDSPI